MVQEIQVGNILNRFLDSDWFQPAIVHLILIGIECRCGWMSSPQHLADYQAECENVGRLKWNLSREMLGGKVPGCPNITLMSMPRRLLAVQQREIHINDPKFVFGGNSWLRQEVEVFGFDVRMDDPCFVDGIDASHHDPCEDHALVPIVTGRIGFDFLQNFAEVFSTFHPFKDLIEGPQRNCPTRLVHLEELNELVAKCLCGWIGLNSTLKLSLVGDKTR